VYQFVIVTASANLPLRANSKRTSHRNNSKTLYSKFNT